jgi:transposase-like protein
LDAALDYADVQTAYYAASSPQPELPMSGTRRWSGVRSNKYLNNLIEQDHRRVKQRLRPMLGLKSFQTAAVVISGIELAEKIKKGQYKIGKLGGRTATMPAIWKAAMAA